ncbi:MAG: tetratricopeptide repeat protein [Ardenticatenia bacterium]|nr:tetratricopeptide repeat protein [Ardenticatenia bacterium]
MLRRSKKKAKASGDVSEQEQRAQYEALIQEGHELLWGGEYSAAIERYRQAVALRPEDPAGYLDLAYALYQAGQKEEALRAYLKAEELEPGNPATLTKIAEIYGDLGRHEAAAATLLVLADRYLSLRQPAEAVRTWQRLLQYDPHNVIALRRLAEAYRRGRRPRLAAKALVALARAYLHNRDVNSAIAACEQALALNPGDRAARELLAELKGEGTKEGDEGFLPTQEVAQRALERMAEAFFEQAEGEDVELGVEALRIRALDYQTRGLYDEAIRAYETILERGHREPEILYNLGVLHQELMHYDEAIAYLREVLDTATESDYIVGAHFAIGQCYQRQGRIDEALNHFLEALKIVDVQSVDRDKADELIKLYESLAESYEAKGDRDTAERFISSLTEFLSDRGWEDKLIEVRHRLGALTGDQVTLAELLGVAESEKVLEGLTTAQKYADQGFVLSALEECYWTLNFAPYYLPLHLQIGDLLVKAGRISEAVRKFEVVADVHVLDGNPKKAMRVLERALEVAPLDVSARSKLVELQVRYGEIDAALENYLRLADGYYQLAQPDRAVEALNEALRLAPRGSQEMKWSRRIRRRLVDIHLQRLDWARAAAVLEQLIHEAPEDVDAAARLADIYYTMGRPDRARQVLQDVTGMLVQKGETGTALALWEQGVAQHPEDVELKIALGQRFLEAGHVERAIETWEEVLEPLVKSGQRAKAAGLLRRMIALHPPQERRYRKMLAILLHQERKK